MQTPNFFPSMPVNAELRAQYLALLALSPLELDQVKRGK